MSIDMPAVHARKDKMITGLTGGIEMLFKKHKIDWIKGTARLTGGKGLEVTLGAGGTQDLTAGKELIVATGSAPRSVLGIVADKKRIIFSDEAIHLHRFPSRSRSSVAAPIGVVGATLDPGAPIMLFATAFTAVARTLNSADNTTSRPTVAFSSTPSVSMPRHRSRC